MKMNDEMSKQSDRHATSKEWASDGRRAAGMIFSSISELSAASKSLAIFLLAGTLLPLLVLHRSAEQITRSGYFRQPNQDCTFSCAARALCYCLQRNPRVTGKRKYYGRKKELQDL